MNYEGLSIRSANCIANANIKTKRHLKAVVESGDILKFRNFGVKSYVEICRWLGMEAFIREPKRRLCPHCQKPIGKFYK